MKLCEFCRLNYYSYAIVLKSYTYVTCVPFYPIDVEEWISKVQILRAATDSVLLLIGTHLVDISLPTCQSSLVSPTHSSSPSHLALPTLVHHTTLKGLNGAATSVQILQCKVLAMYNAQQCKICILTMVCNVNFIS